METTIWNLDEAKTYHIHSAGLAQWLVATLDKSKIVNDFGCGPGYYLKHLHEAGFTCFGYEGTEGINDISYFKGIQQADITKPIDAYKGTVLCMEVMEHIPAEHESAALNNICAACDDKLILSWGVPDQPGHGHINCRDQHYVVTTMAMRGFVIDFLETMQARDAAISTPHTDFFKYTLYVFKKVAP